MDQPQVPAPAHQKNTLMAILAYVGPLVIVSYLVAKDDPFVKFHIKQGLVLFVIEVVLWVLMDMFYWQIYMLWPLIDLIDLAILVFAVMGIVNAAQGKEVQLPIIGSWSSSFPI
jgi:uncharacterized membrane protein